MTIAIPLFFILVFGLVGIGAILGFVLAAYVFRSRVFILVARWLGTENSTAVLVAFGLALAILLPLVGGIAYALSGTAWMLQVFGELGQLYWAWVGAAFLLGFVLACIARLPQPSST